MQRERSEAPAHIVYGMTPIQQGSGRVLRALAIVAVVTTIALASMAGSRAQEGAVAVEVRIWQHVDHGETLYISARPARGSWRTLGTIRLSLKEGLFPGHDYRYTDLTIDVPREGLGPVAVAVGVWQHVEWTNTIYVSAWPTYPSWYRPNPILLALDDGLGPREEYRYGDIALGVPLPSAPRPESCDGGIAVPDPGRNPGLVQDCEVLLEARDVLLGDGPALNWSPDRPLVEWAGVTVDGRPGRVTALDLGGRDLSGSIPPELTDLDHLQQLDLGFNELTGVIPPELSQLPNLHTLQLGANQLTGEIPPELGSFATIRSLSLGGNALTGAIPPELGQLTTLVGLNLAGNQLSGAIPPELGMLVNAETIYLSSNQLSGDIPRELTNIPNLRTLSTYRNEIGCIPAPLLEAIPDVWLDGGGRLSHYESICASIDYEDAAAACAADGAVEDPAENAGLVNDCAALLVARARLVGDRSGSDGEALDNWKADVPVAEWLGVTVGGSPLRVTELAVPYGYYVGRYALVGILPRELGLLSRLEVLDLSDSHWISGSIPPELGALSSLRILNLEDNRLTGEIPPELGDLSSLEELRLGGNELTGEIPAELGRLGELRILSLSSWLSGGVYGGNQLRGQIPPEIGRLANLEQLDLSNSLLTGAIPTELGALSKLMLLDLNDSQISGPIPPELGSLASLKGLDLARTRISGAIPPELGSLSSLTGLDLSSTQISGEIPPELGMLANLRDLSLSGNQLAGTIPPELGMLVNLSTLNLSDSRLGGPLPPELGSLARLKRMYLRENQLTGGIPREFGQLRELETLDLRGNQLTGSIPAELGDLPFNSYFGGLYLSGNEWSGCLPLSLRPLLEISDYLWTSDLRRLRLSYCQCLAPPDETAVPDLTVGADGIPHLRGGDETGVAGTYRLTFSLVIDLPAGGVFRLGQRSPGRDNDGDMRVSIYETTSASALVIDPFTGYEYSRSVVDGPADCENNPSRLFDLIVDSARNQPPYTPAAPATIESPDRLEYLEGGRTYWLNADVHLIFDVPEGARFRRGWSGLCADPGRCYSFLTLTDDETNSTLRLDVETGEPGWRTEVTEAGMEQGVDAVFDQITASVRQHPAPPSCERPETAPDCAILLDARDALAGEAELNWSEDVPIHHWWGVTVDRWTGRVTEVHPGRRGLTGRIPPALGELSALKVLWLGPSNRLTGEIPAELGQLSDLESLYLRGNHLTGEIPEELGRLPNLRSVDLQGNRLEGCLPDAWQQFRIEMGTEASNPDLRRCDEQ